MTIDGLCVKRRWTVRARRPSGEQVWMVVAVPDDGGVIYMQVGPSRLTFEPAEVSRLRRVLQEAQLTALQDRDEW